MRIREILDTGRMVMDLQGSTKKEVLEQLAAPLATTNPEIDQGELIETLVKREEDSTTAIADNIAFPHARIPLADNVEEVAAAFGLAAGGVDFDSVDQQPTRIFCLLVAPQKHPSLSLRWIAHLARLLKDPQVRESIIAAESADQVLDILDSAEQAQADQP